MEPLFASSVEEVRRLVGLGEPELDLLEVADAAASELVVSEFERYVERKYNEQVPIVLKKHQLMGVPIQEKYGGRGARQLVQALFIERLGQVGLGPVTFTDVHQCLGSLTIQDWGNEEQRGRYLPKAANGDVILA
jgi:alkylation response protein AidB-like acyl-CoA dehydrogenase